MSAARMLEMEQAVLDSSRTQPRDEVQHETASESANDQASPPLETPVRFPCPFLGCGDTRLYEGGKPVLFTHLDTCRRCEMRIAVTPDENAFANIVAKGLT